MSRRILVVEDNPLNLKLLTDVLQAHGYRVDRASCGEEGLEALSQGAPDLVLMDLQLPGLDGTQTMALMREAGLGEEVAIVAVTAFAMPADRERALAAGFDGFIEKPISVRALPDQVRSYLTDRQQ